MIGALLIVTILSFAGMSAVQLTGIESSTSVNVINNAHTTYIGEAGIEYAKRRLYQGQNPNNVSRTVGNSSFTVTTSPSTREVTVASTLGSSSKSQVITTNFSKNCVVFDVSTVSSSIDTLQNVKLTKSCNESVIIDKVTITWNWHTCVTGDTYNPPTNDLSGCASNTGGATLKWIAFNNTEIYNAGSAIGSPSGSGVNSGQEVDAQNYSFSTNATYTFVGDPKKIGFSTTITPHGLYTITITFLDGSSLSKTFQDPTT